MCLIISFDLHYMSLLLSRGLCLNTSPFKKTGKGIPMETFKKKLIEELRNHKISRDYTKYVDKLTEQGILKEGMPYKALLNTFFISMSESEKVFEGILKDKYAFDLTCMINTKSIGQVDSETEIASKLQRSFLKRLKYVHVECNGAEIFIGLKFTKEIYTQLKNCDLEPYLYPYKLLLFDESIKITDYKFDQPIIPYNEPSDIQIKYAEFIEHLKTLNLPLAVVGDDILFQKTNIINIFDIFIYLEASSQWPKDESAVECAKTAFYCQMYAKSKYRHSISREYCIFKYKNLYFKIKILIKSDISPRYNVLIGLQNVVKKHGCSFQRKIRMAKTIFASLGLYPLHFDDYFVDLISLVVGSEVVGDSKFIENLLSFNFDFKNDTFDLEALKLFKSTHDSEVLKIRYRNDVFNFTLPSPDLINNIKNTFKTIKNTIYTLNSDFYPQNVDLFTLDVSEYDVVLSRDSISGSVEILGNITDSFDLGTPDIKEFKVLPIFRMASFYYNPLSKILLAKIDTDTNIELFTNLLILETSFGYLKTKGK